MLDVLGEVVHLVGLSSHVDLADALPVAVDAVVGHETLDAVEVLAAQASQFCQLTRPPVQAVGKAVGQRRSDEAAVTPRGTVGHGAALDDDDIQIWVGGLGFNRRPQASETAADDQQVSGQCADDARLVDGMVGVIQPIGLLADVGQGRQDIGTCDVGEDHRGWLSRA